MTPSRYYVARFAQAFGFFRRNQRMSDAASELHLLREAEAQLGIAVWTKVENIEALSVEYWNLRRFLKERNEIHEQLAVCQSRLDEAHEVRAIVVNGTSEAQQVHLDERVALLIELEKLAIERDHIVADAREVRRSYDGLKMKLAVLTSEASDSPEGQKQITTVKQKLQEFQKRFAELKQERIEIGERIDQGDMQLDDVDKKLAETRQSRRVSASEAFQSIGDGTKEVSALRASSGLLGTQMRQLYAEVGRYVSRNAHWDAACAEATSEHRGLVDIMRALRRSISLNHHLAKNK